MKGRIKGGRKDRREEGKKKERRKIYNTRRSKLIIYRKNYNSTIWNQ